MGKMNVPNERHGPRNPAEQDHAELLEAILDRSTTDLKFRQALVCEPKDAIFDAFGVRIPDHYQLRFVERDPEFDSVVVLPDYEDPEGSLSDDDLDVVHGGDGGGDPGPAETW